MKKYSSNESISSSRSLNDPEQSAGEEAEEEDDVEDDDEEKDKN